MNELEDDKDLTPYAGRWVALVRGKIVAQGDTAEIAAHTARQSRTKETLEIVFVPDPHTSFDNPLLGTILRTLKPDQEIYLVGGAVRDFLLRRETHDLDFVVPANGIKIARQVAKAMKSAFFILDEKTDTGRVILTQDDLSREVLDFASYRKNGLDADLSARDFSINALAYNLRTKEFKDPVGGTKDLRLGVIRACSAAAFKDDPVRILRAVRFAAALGYSIHKETRTRMKQSIDLLAQPSPERIRDELFKILDGPKPSSVIRALDLLGGLPYLFPEIVPLKHVEQPPPHVLDGWEHTLKSVDHLEAIFKVMDLHYKSDLANDLLTGLLSMKLGRYRQNFKNHFEKSSVAERSRRALLVFAVLYHDVGKSSTIKKDGERIQFIGHEKVGSSIAVGRAIKLRMSNSEMDYLKVVIQNHMRIVQHIHYYEREGKIPTSRAVYRFFRDTGEVGVDICFLALADLRATYENEMTQSLWAAALDVVKIFLENWWEKREQSITPPPVVNGNDLIGMFHLEAGPVIGKLLEAIQEAQAVGEIQTREDALKLAEQWLIERKSGKKAG
jgi:tRNA nucleotidyltransferase/poly(A) polymerase